MKKLTLQCMAMILLSLIVLLGAGCRPPERTGFDPKRHTFVDVSTGSSNGVVLTTTAASNLVALLRGAEADRRPAAAPVATGLPPPASFPDLLVNVYGDSTRTQLLGQVLGYNRQTIVGPDCVIKQSNTVNSVYQAVGR